jgi:hypothetical protein
MITRLPDFIPAKPMAWLIKPAQILFPLSQWLADQTRTDSIPAKAMA